MYRKAQKQDTPSESFELSFGGKLVPRGGSQKSKVKSQKSDFIGF